MRKYSLTPFILGLFIPLALYAEEDPCRGTEMMLSLVNRPSFSDSPCTVPPKKLLFEGGYQNQKLIGGGSEINLPEPTIRAGLSNNAEFALNTTNYIHQTVFPFSGTTSTWLALKQRLYYDKKWIVTGEILASPTSGNNAFGSPNPQGEANFILFNNVTNKLSWQFQIGVGSFSDPLIDGGTQYESINPNFLISYTFIKKISTYVEFFSQSKTSSDEALGIIGGLGFIYLLNSKTTLDIAAYQRIMGAVGGFERFIGVGMSRLLF